MRVDLRASFRFLAIVLFFSTGSAHAFQCDDLWSVLAQDCDRIVDTYRRGDDELLVSGYSWHLPGAWSAERRRDLNSAAWGGGLGRTVEEGDEATHTVFFLAFLDSHKHIESQVGYAYSRYWGSRAGLQFGLGYTAAIVQRPDIASGIPFPAVLPLFSMRAGKVTVSSTFIPRLSGGINHGSTLYFFGRYALE